MRQDVECDIAVSTQAQRPSGLRGVAVSSSRGRIESGKDAAQRLSRRMEHGDRGWRRDRRRGRAGTGCRSGVEDGRLPVNVIAHGSGPRLHYGQRPLIDLLEDFAGALGALFEVDMPRART